MQKQKQKIAGYTRLVYSAKKQKIVKKTIKVKKSHLVALAILIGLAVIAYQYAMLLSDIGKIAVEWSLESRKQQSSVMSQVETNNTTDRQITAPDPFFKFRPKTASTMSEIDVYLAVIEACKYHAIDNEDCRQDLMGIAYAETRDFTNKIGDAGKSYGIMQIHLGYHNHITADQANDIYFATKWTLGRMINNGYKTNRDRAIRMHNGSPTNPKTLAYLQTVKKYTNQ